MTSTTAPTFIPTARLDDDGDHLVVRTTWTSPDVELDRTDGIGYGFGHGQRKVALRMIAAINADVVFYDKQLAVDIHGKTYVATRSRVLGRIANADLHRLGF